MVMETGEKRNALKDMGVDSWAQLNVQDPGSPVPTLRITTWLTRDPSLKVGPHLHRDG